MSNNYQLKISRRDGIKWLGSLATVVVIGGVTVACDSPAPEAIPVDPTSHWPDLKFEPITGPKYGQDPKLAEPTRPWSLTFTSEQRNLVAQLCDIICPADEGGPSAKDIGVPEVVDEWISAPYSAQQQDRVLILNGLQWLDDEAKDGEYSQISLTGVDSIMIDVKEVKMIEFMEKTWEIKNGKESI